MNGFKVGQLIRPRGRNGNNNDLFEVVYQTSKYIQCFNLKQNGFISIPKTASNTYRVATEADIQSYISRYLKYHIIQTYSDNGKWKVSSDLVATI